MAEYDEFMAEMFPTGEDVFRCQSTFSRLARHLKRTLVLTGGLAAGWHTTRSGRRMGKRPFNDIDIVVEHISDLPQSLGDDFLVAHFHPSRGRGRILLQLVDERHRVRIDVFTPFSPSLMSRVRSARLAGIACGIVAAEDIAARLLGILYAVTTGERVDPKYYDKFKLLSGFADMDAVRRIWQDYRKEGYSQDFEVAVDTVHRIIANSPGLLRKDSYDQDLNTTCPWCSDGNLFPVSARSRIFDILGYV